VIQYFWQAYGVSIDEILAPGGDYTVELAHGGSLGWTDDPVFGTDWPTLNVDRCQEDVDLFNAALLHELTHFLHYQGGWKPGFVNRRKALEAANEAKKRAGGHGPETFLAEIYQFGRVLTQR
jgi:hypothetical protein